MNVIKSGFKEAKASILTVGQRHANTNAALSVNPVAHPCLIEKSK